MRSKRRAGLNQLGPPPRVPTGVGYLPRRKKKLSEEGLARAALFNEEHGITGPLPEEEAYARQRRGMEAGRFENDRRRCQESEEKKHSEPAAWPREKILEWMDARRIGTREATKLSGMTVLEFAEWMISLGRWERRFCGVTRAAHLAVVRAMTDQQLRTEVTVEEAREEWRRRYRQVILDCFGGYGGVRAWQDRSLTCSYSYVSGRGRR